jgi:hypothetical protein
MGQASAGQLFVLLDVPLVERAAICGNQVCEAGERAPAGTNILGVPRSHWCTRQGLGFLERCVGY